MVNIFERPPVRSARWWAFDVFLMLLVVAFSIPDWSHSHGVPVWIIVVIGAASTGPLLVRRVWPEAVFGWIFVITGISALADVHLASGLATLVALYTVASWCPRRTALITAAVLELGAIAASVRVSGSNWWYALIFLTGMVAAASGLGLYAATRRAYLRELHDRAERLERERDQTNELAVISERARIAREMHDIVAHHLSVIVALSDGAAAAAVTSPQRSAEVMRTVSATGRQALADTRSLLGVLADDRSEDRQPVPGLDGLNALVDGVRAAGLPVRYEVQGATADLPAGAQLAVYRLVQEALTNTLKHGGDGTHATVSLRYLSGELQVEIEDDGAGARRFIPRRSDGAWPACRNGSRRSAVECRPARAFRPAGGFRPRCGSRRTCRRDQGSAGGRPVPDAARVPDDPRGRARPVRRG